MARLSTAGESHFRDLKQFIVYWKKNPAGAGLFQNHRFLLGVGADGKRYWRVPDKLCLDIPYEETGLAGLSEIHEKYALWDAYKEKLPKSMLGDFTAFAKAVGIMHNLNVECIDSLNNPNRRDLRRDYYQHRVKWTNTAIDSDYSIHGIEQYLATQSVLASHLIWEALIRADRKIRDGTLPPEPAIPN